MSDPALLSILHLSDFHFTKRKLRDQRVVVDALVKDLETLCIGHRRPDLVIFTGDLVNGGGDDSHEEAYDFLLSRVAQATGCSDERTFIVPGNHDLSRKVVEETAETQRQWRELSNDSDGLNKIYGSSGFADLAARKFHAHRDLENYLADGTLRYRNEFVTVHHVTALNTDIVILNTAMFSTGGLPAFGKDEGKLAIPEHAMLDAFQALTDGAFRIFATHHPFGMLSEGGARTLSQAIEDHGDMHLFGHMHDPQARSVISFKGQLFSDQAGAVFTHRRDAYIGYSLISVTPTDRFYETHLRTYFDDRKAFDDGIDVVPNGRFYSSQGARQFWRKIATPLDENTLRAHLAGPCLDELNAELDAGSDRETHERFVPPPMKRTFVQPAAGDQTKSVVETPVSFDELVNGDDNIILYAAAEYGRTTILKQAAFRHFADAETMRLPRIPIIVDFADVKQNVGNLTRVVRSRAPDLPDGIDTDSILKLGHAFVMFDDVVFEDTRRMTILREFVAAYPKLRYVLSSAKNSASQYGSHVNPEMPLHFEFVELCVLRIREMRQLVVKFNGCTDVEAVLERLQSEFREINLPFTAANGSILMSIYETQSGFRPINRSVLIEQFIDSMLKKAAAEQIRRETFDYANKTALLAHVAAWMAKENEYIPSSESVRDVMKGYIDKMGLIAPIDQLMSEFLTARILVRRADERVSFGYRAVLEYFIALQMGNDGEFKAWVMDNDRYLQFVNEIQYYAGRLRNDTALVDEIGERFSAIMSDIAAEHGPLDIEQIAKIKLPAKDSDVASDMLSRQLAAAPLTQEERDEALEADLPTDAEGRQEVFRPQVVDPGQKLIVALFLYSGVVKNMELIDDASKRRHLQALWGGWATFLFLSLTVVPEIAKHRKFRINGVLYELNAPVGMTDGELTRIISLNMPVGITQMISSTLGTEKLERQLIEPELEVADEPLVVEFLRTSLIADLRLNATPSALANSLDALRESAYLREVLIWKIGALRRMDRIAQRHLDAIESPLAGAMADLKGGTAKMRANEKRRQVKRIREQGLILKIKRQNEKD